MKIWKLEYTHIGGKKINEDAFVSRELTEQSVFAAVADGLEDLGNGKLAAQIVIKNLTQCGMCSILPTEFQIRNWFQGANLEIQAKGRGAAGMRSTAVFLAVFHGCAVWAHSGDSRLYHFHDGQIRNSTNDHSVPQMKVAAGEMTRNEIPFSPDRNKVLKALGTADWEPEIAPAIRLQPGRHAFLLCTDGFWEYLTDEEIWLDLNKSVSPAAWLNYLRCRGESRKSENADNNTAVAIFVDV